MPAPYPPLDPYRRSRYDDGVDAKIVVMGNTGVGKTSLLQRYTQNKFDPKNTTATTGAFFVTKKVVLDGGAKVRLQLWDTAGQERFRSMAPMYYRGANAALLLYDITSVASFNDVKGWMEELKKNCEPELIIYIVGAKADLAAHRQVSPDLARLSLATWFPPPRPPTPPPPAIVQTHSTFSYIRPRFTSFTSIRSAPLSPTSHTPTSNAPPVVLAPKPSPPESSASSGYEHHPHQQYLHHYHNGHLHPPHGAGPGIAAVPLKRANTTGVPAARSTGALVVSRAKSTSSSSPTPPPVANGAGSVPFSRFGRGWNEDNGGGAYDDSRSLFEDEDEDEYDDEGDGGDGGDGDEGDDAEWGLSKGMELFEVSAKDNTGVLALFDALVAAIVHRCAAIELENDLKRRDSVLLAPATHAVPPPSWAATADAEEAEVAAREKAARGVGGGMRLAGCCAT